MLATYQAKIVNNQIKWIDTPPDFDDVYVTVTVFPNLKLEKQNNSKVEHQNTNQKNLSEVLLTIPQLDGYDNEDIFASDKAPMRDIDWVE